VLRVLAVFWELMFSGICSNCSRIEREIIGTISEESDAGGNASAYFPETTSLVLLIQVPEY
jgi:hypothetical protein